MCPATAGPGDYALPPGSPTLAVSYSYDGVSTPRIEGEAWSSQSGSSGLDYKTAASNGQVLGSNWGGAAGNYAQYNNLVFGESGKNTYLVLYYANGNAASVVEVLVDGVSKGTLTGKSTGGWGTNANELQPLVLDLGVISAGTHTLKLRVNSAGQNINIDRFFLSSGRAGQARSVTDGSGGAKWLYDDQGQPVWEQKTISGSAYTSLWSLLKKLV